MEIFVSEFKKKMKFALNFFPPKIIQFLCEKWPKNLSQKIHCSQSYACIKINKDEDFVGYLVILLSTPKSTRGVSQCGLAIYIIIKKDLNEKRRIMETQIFSPCMHAKNVIFKKKSSKRNPKSFNISEEL